MCLPRQRFQLTTQCYNLKVLLCIPSSITKKKPWVFGSQPIWSTKTVWVQEKFSNMATHTATVRSVAATCICVTLCNYTINYLHVVYNCNLMVDSLTMFTAKDRWILFQPDYALNPLTIAIFSSCPHITPCFFFLSLSHNFDDTLALNIIIASIYGC